MVFKSRGLRHRITVQREETTADGAGGFAVSWVNFLGSAAEVKTSGSREVFYGRQLVPSATHSVRLRWRAGITTAMRVLFRARVLEIRGIVDVGELRRELVLTCEESPLSATVDR